ncbi:MAG TPA: aspartate aminotransferase family protein [Thiolinea sp.]|nr:aspartate aminotransferase family protein [Thiolinea sp.]
MTNYQAQDAAHHIHPFTDTAHLNQKGARVITRAEGVYIYDSQGNRILDGMAGLWCVGVGYGREEIVQAVSAQMRELPYYNTFFQTTHPPVIELAARLTSLAPDHMNHVFFTGSGSDANDTILRMVRHFWAAQGKPERSVIISRNNAYHGSTVAGASLGGMSAVHKQGGLPIPGIVHINQPYWYGEGGDLDPNEFGLQRARELETKILEVGADKVAAFIGEPIQGAGGVIIPPKTYWPEIERICRKYDILLITDEVITGFGRTGEWFGADYFGVKSDLMTIAKGLTAGYIPMGGVMVSDRVFDVVANHGEFYHGYTYSGHPVACAAALATLAILEGENLPGRVKSDIGPYMQERWLKLGEHPLIGEARMAGLVGGIELTPNKAKRAPFQAEKGTVGLMCRENSFKNGLVMRHVGDTMIISPPLVISHSEVDELIEKATLTLDQTYQQAKDKGLLS